MRLRLGIGLGFLAWAVALVTGLAGLQLVAGGLLVCLVPGLGVLRLIRAPHGPAFQRTLLAGTISPIILGLAAWLATVTGRPVPVTGVAVLIFFGIVAAWPTRAASRQAGEKVPNCSRSGERDGFVPLLAGLSGGLVALGYLNPYVRNWSDAWAHAAIFEEVLRAGIPPQFPHFAGHAMPYAWFFHVFLASASGVISRDPLVLMAVLNVWTALLLPLGVYDLARTMGLKPAACRWSAAAGLIGTNPLGPVWLLGRSLLGQTAGLGELGRSLSTSSNVLGSLAFHFTPFQATLFGRLWTPSAFMFAVLLACVVLSLFISYWGRAGVRGALALLATLAFLFVWHPLTAMQVSVGVAAGVLVAVALSQRDERASALWRGVVVALAGIAAYLAALPYLRIATGGTAPGRLANLQLSQRNLMGLVISMGPTFVLALIGWARLDPRRRRLIGGLLVGLLGVFLVVSVAGFAEEKFYYPLFVVVAAMAGLALEVMWSRSLLWRAAVSALVTGGVLTAGFTAVGFMRDQRPIRELFARVSPGDPRLLTRDEDAALRWIREWAPRDAVFLQFPRPNGPEPILVLGRRRLYLGMAENFYRGAFNSRGDEPPVPQPIWQELKRREALQLAAFSDRSLGPDSLAMLRSTPWPLLVWWDSSLGEGRLSPSLRPGAGATRELLTTPGVRVLEIIPSR
jgi:hypothetical protein